MSKDTSHRHTRKPLTLEQILLLLFGALTIMMIITRECFYINDVIATPQFAHFHVFDEIIAQIGPDQKSWYRAFFMVDFFWAATGLFLLYRWYLSLTRGVMTYQAPFKWSHLSFVFFACLAWLFDGWENIQYLLERQDLVKWPALPATVKLKKLMYGIVLLHLVIAIYHKYLASHRDELKKFLKASFLSLIIVIALGLLITKMEQGGTVLVHLLESPASLLLAFIFVNILALACSHYPDYLQMFFDQDTRTTWNIWLIPPFKWIGMGLITYSYKEDSTPKDSSPAKPGLNFFHHLRKNLGTLFLITWIYVFLYVLHLYVDHAWSPGPFTLALLVVAGLFYRHCENVKRRLKEGEIHSEEIQPYRLWTLLMAVVTVISLAATIYASAMYGWSRMTYILTMTTSVLNLIFFILFLNFRTNFYHWTPPHFLWKLIPVYRLGNHLLYVGMFSVVGYLSFMLIVYAHLYPSRINPLVLLLGYLYFYYGAIVVPLKHHLYYSAAERYRTRSRSGRIESFFRYYVPVLGFVIFVILLVMGQVGNGLHVLHLVEEEEPVVTMDEYTTALSTNLQNNKDLYLLASYGGGIRAQTWTLLLLDTLDKMPNRPLERMLAMSGVSGGFLGLSSYYAIRTEHTDVEARRAAIERIGTHNIVSIDLTYLLGADLVREIIPRDSFFYPDRSGRSIEEYIRLIQPEAGLQQDLNTMSFRRYWEKGFRKGEHFAPALIGNTTGTHGMHGVAFSLRVDTPERCFPGADQILNPEPGKTLRFMDAASTTERFPIFSPTAQVRGLGHYLDGGYFENSGLLSLINFYDYLNKKNVVPDTQRIKVILIVNSRESYARSIVPDTLLRRTKDVATGELPAIVKTVTSIEILPRALEAKLQEQYGEDFVRIYLPYPLWIEDIEHIAGGPLADPLAVQEILDSSNQVITEVLEAHTDETWGQVYPPLARLLGKHAFEYTKAMLRHPEVLDALNKIK